MARDLNSTVDDSQNISTIFRMFLGVIFERERPADGISDEEQEKMVDENFAAVEKDANIMLQTFKREHPEALLTQGFVCAAYMVAIQKEFDYDSIEPERPAKARAHKPQHVEEDAFIIINGLLGIKPRELNTQMYKFLNAINFEIPASLHPVEETGEVQPEATPSPTRLTHS